MYDEVCLDFAECIPSRAPLRRRGRGRTASSSVTRSYSTRRSAAATLSSQTTAFPGARTTCSMTARTSSATSLVATTRQEVRCFFAYCPVVQRVLYRVHHCLLCDVRCSAVLAVVQHVVVCLQQCCIRRTKLLKALAILCRQAEDHIPRGLLRIAYRMELPVPDQGVDEHHVPPERQWRDSPRFALLVRSAVMCPIFFLGLRCWECNQLACKFVCHWRVREHFRCSYHSKWSLQRELVICRPVS